MKKYKYFLVAFVMCLGLGLGTVAYHGSIHQSTFITMAQADGPVIVPPPVVIPADASAAFNDAKLLFEAVRSGQWTLVVGLALMLIIYLLRMFLLPRFNISPPKWLPWLAMGLSLIGAFATALASGQSWLTALLSGITVGATSSGLWSLLGGLLPTAPDQVVVLSSAKGAAKSKK